MYKNVSLRISILVFVIFFAGCNKNKKDIESAFNDVIESVDELFGIEIPSEVSKITVYKEGWQSSGLYVYFEIPSEYLVNVKSNDALWQEIPDRFRDLPCSVESINRGDFENEQLYILFLNMENYFRMTKSYYKIHNNSSDKIQWYYYKRDYGEKIIQKMISEPQNNICNCYFSDGDLTYTDKGQKLYQHIKTEKSITFYRDKHKTD